MKVQIKETGKTETLSLIAETGICWAQDCIGNHGGLIDGQFSYDEDAGAYVCSQETYEWWNDYFAAQQKADDRIAELKKEHGSEKVYAALHAAEVGYNDLEDQPAAINAALDEAFGNE